MPVKHKTLPSVEYLQSCFDYDPDSGVIRWRNCRGNKKAGHLEKGYLNLTIDGVHYRAARVIWKMVTGKEPPEIVDHADQIKLNNRWSNLREATPAQSLRNRGSGPNKSGYRGVHRIGNKYRAMICRDNVRHYLGTYTTAKEASKVYERAARKFHEEFYYRANS